MGDVKRSEVSGSILGDKRSSLFVDNQTGLPLDSKLLPATRASTGVDPASVESAAAIVDPEVMAIVVSKRGAPRTGELVAARLAQRFGPFSASNTEANRQAILRNIQWLAGTGITYSNPRAGTGDVSTQAPNITISTGRGVCRDIHVAASAVLSSLMNARREGTGWVAGEPSNTGVETIGFGNPEENHAFTVYRDPATGGWNAIEYGKHYALNAANQWDALRALPNWAPTTHSYLLNGWNGKAVVQRARVVDAWQALSFFRRDEGTGKSGELRAASSAERLALTAFVSPRLSVSIEANPSQLTTGKLDGGAKLNFHADKQGPRSDGYLHLAAGMYRVHFSASDTGKRAVSDRHDFAQTVFVVAADGRLSGARPLLGEQLRLSWSMGAEVVGGVALTDTPAPASATHTKPSVRQYSLSFADASLGLSGRQRTASGTELEWAARYRQDADPSLVIVAALSGTRPIEPGRFQAAVAATWKASASSLRTELGGSFNLSAADWYAALSVKSDATSDEPGTYRVGLIIRGRSDALVWVPIESIGAAAQAQVSRRLSVGVSGDAKASGTKPAVQILGTAALTF